VTSASGSIVENRQRTGSRRRLFVSLLLLVIGIAVVTLTAHLSRQPDFAWLRSQRDRIISAELGLFGVLIVESIANWIVYQFRRFDALQTGIAVRAVLRMTSYSIVTISIVSILASNSALAIGVGGVTGVLVAFSAQNLVGNAFAGVFLAIAKPFKIGDEITVMGVTGRVTDIRVMHTTLNLGNEVALIPSNVLMTQMIRRKPAIGEDDFD